MGCGSSTSAVEDSKPEAIDQQTMQKKTNKKNNEGKNDTTKSASADQTKALDASISASSIAKVAVRAGVHAAIDIKKKSTASSSSLHAEENNTTRGKPHGKVGSTSHNDTSTVVKKIQERLVSPQAYDGMSAPTNGK